MFAHDARIVLAIHARHLTVNPNAWGLRRYNHQRIAGSVKIEFERLGRPDEILEQPCSAGNKIDANNGGYYTRIDIDIHDIMPMLGLMWGITIFLYPAPYLFNRIRRC